MNQGEGRNAGTPGRGLGFPGERAGNSRVRGRNRSVPPAAAILPARRPVAAAGRHGG